MKHPIIYSAGTMPNKIRICPKTFEPLLAESVLRSWMTFAEAHPNQIYTKLAYSTLLAYLPQRETLLSKTVRTCKLMEKNISANVCSLVVHIIFVLKQREESYVA